MPGLVILVLVAVVYVFSREAARILAIALLSVFTVANVVVSGIATFIFLEPLVGIQY